MKQEQGRGGFTLVEMLVVITIIGILMGVLGTSLIQARNHARRTKSETQLREMITAFITYYNAYGAWPDGLGNSSTEVLVTEAMLEPLITTNNNLGLVLLNKTFTTIERDNSMSLYGDVYYLDPWDQPYRLKTSADAAVTNQIAQTISVWFPNKDRSWEE